MATLAELLSAGTKTQSISTGWVKAADLAQDGTKFKISKIEKAKGYKGKDMIRYHLILEDGMTSMLDLTPTEQRLEQAKLMTPEVLKQAEGYAKLSRVDLKNGRFTYEFTE